MSSSAGDIRGALVLADAAHNKSNALLSNLSRFGWWSIDSDDGIVVSDSRRLTNDGDRTHSTSLFPKRGRSSWR
jgi:hypothetical protein